MADHKSVRTFAIIAITAIGMAGFVGSIVDNSKTAVSLVPPAHAQPKPADLFAPISAVLNHPAA